MSQVVYNLMNGATLRSMAPPTQRGDGTYGDASLPQGLGGQGMFILVNTSSNNRFAGTSVDLAQRFSTRLATVTEMGFTADQMERLWIFWGIAFVQNTPGYQGNQNPPIIPVQNYNTPLLTPIDGVDVSVERLLIRFLLLHLGAAGTVSNNVLNFGPYQNPTGSNVRVTLNWKPGFFATSSSSATWSAGQSW